MKVKEIFSKTILTRTAIEGFDYCVNPYVGCGHGCRYCYASFMKRFTGHREPWGEFVDIKVNAPRLLKLQIRRAKRGWVSLSTVTDPYQPLERSYRVTRECLKVLLEAQFPVNLLSRSPLCLRDIDLFKQFEEIEVGLSIPTHDEKMKRIFEPRSPSIQARVNTLKTLHRAHIKTYVFIGPMLPLDPGRLVAMLDGWVDEVLIDRMNYPNKVKRLYKKNRLDAFLTDDYFKVIGTDLKDRFQKKGVAVSLFF